MRLFALSKHLDRKLAGQRLAALGDQLVHSHKIPPKVASTPAGGGGAYPVNRSERRLQELLLQAGFEEGIRGEQLRLDRALGTTTPDVIYRTTEHAPDEGVSIYLDGLSAHLHGNPTTAERESIAHECAEAYPPATRRNPIWARRAALRGLRVFIRTECQPPRFTPRPFSNDEPAIHYSACPWPISRSRLAVQPDQKSPNE